MHKTWKRFGFWWGIFIFSTLMWMSVPKGMSVNAWHTAAVSILMFIWWITEPVPIAATSLLPIVLFPLLGIMGTKETSLQYGDHLIFLFMGGFFIAVTMEKWGVQRRLAYHIIARTGTSPARLLLSFMGATAFIAFWISNTATTMMMVPIGLALAESTYENASGHKELKAKSDFTAAMMLAAAYASTIGGISSLVSTPPNTISAALMDEMYGISVGFFDWLKVSLPLAVMMFFFTWYLLGFVLFRHKQEGFEKNHRQIKEQLRNMGPMRREEKWIVVVLVSVALLWILRDLMDLQEFAKITDATIAIAGALVLFALPSASDKKGRILDWATAVKIPWDIILLFGGGLTLANGFVESGLTSWIATRFLEWKDASFLEIMLMAILVTKLVTEVVSNTATATILVPIVGATAFSMGIHPIGPVFATSMMASFAFIFPIGTPPNAIAYGSKGVTMTQMAKAGIWLSLFSVVLTTGYVVYVVPRIWHIDLLHFADKVIR